jgi:hypothetical protein
MRVMVKVLSPGVQHGGYDDIGTEVLRIASDREERLRRCFEQEPVDRRLVLIGDRPDRGRQRKDDMEVGDGKQLGFTPGEPFCSRPPLALRAVAVATGVVGDAREGAVLTSLDMPAERRRATILDRRHDAQLAALTWPALASRHASPWRRKISATSKLERGTLAQAGGAGPKFSRSSGL